MITYALSGWAMVARRFWAIRYWLAAHKWWSRILAVVTIDLLLVIFGNTVIAYAADGDGGVVSPFLPGGSIHDSAGVPLSHYIVLPLDRGDVFTWGKAIVAAPLDFIWSGHLGAFSWMIWLCEWIISFQWIDLITVPFGAIANTLQDGLGRLNWIPFALAVTAGIAGIAVLAGKKASGWLDMLVSAFLAFLAVGILANPITTITSAGGALDTAREWGNSLAVAVATDNADQAANAKFHSDDILTEVVSSQLVDIFVKIPAQSLAFGHVLEGECATVFNESMTTRAPVVSNGNDVRDAVGGCDEAAKNFVQNPNFGQVITALMISPGALVLLGFPVALAVLFFGAMMRLMWDSLKTMLSIYWAILPVNRHALWKSLAGVATGIVSVVLLIVLMAASLRLLVGFLTGLSGMGVSIVALMMIANLFLLVLLFLLVRAKRAARRAGETLAEHLSKVGLARGGSAPANPIKSMAAMSMATTLGSAALHRPDRNYDARSIHNYGMGRPGAGPMNFTASPIPPAGPPSMTPRPMGPAGPRSPSPLPVGSGPGSRRVLEAGGKTAKTAGAALTAARVAKGAVGGVPGLVGSAAAAAGSRPATRSGNQMMQKALGKGATSTPSASSTPAAPSKPSAASFIVPSRRIIVDEAGVGRINRPAPSSNTVYDISSLPPVAPRSPRNEALRDMLSSRRAA